MGLSAELDKLKRTEEEAKTRGDRIKQLEEELRQVIAGAAVLAVSMSAGGNLENQAEGSGESHQLVPIQKLYDYI